MRVIVLHNPTAGEKDLPRDDLLDLLRAAGHEPVYYSTRDGGRGAGRLQETGDVLLAAGGDGTVRKAALEFGDAAMPIAILPLGTANNIARSLGVPDDPHAVIASLDRARRTAFDVGRAKGTFGTARFLEGLGFGLFAEMMAVAKTHAIRGGRDIGVDAEIQRDLRMLKALLPLHRATPAVIEVDGGAIEGSMLMVEVMNIASVGPSLRLAPEASSADGLLNVVIADESRRAELAAYLDERLSGRSDAVPELPRYRTTRVRIEWTSPLVHLDDTRWPPRDEERTAGQQLIFEIAVEPRARWFLVPDRPAPAAAAGATAA
jgi:diacylglycerol kinase (ATP)